RPAAAPAIGVTVARVVIDAIEVSLDQRHLLSRSIDAGQRHHLEPLARTDAEAAVAAVPTAGEHHFMALGDRESAVIIEHRVYIERGPVERLRPVRLAARVRPRERDDAHEQRAPAHGETPRAADGATTPAAGRFHDC